MKKNKIFFKAGLISSLFLLSVIILISCSKKNIYNQKAIDLNNKGIDLHREQFLSRNYDNNVLKLLDSAIGLDPNYYLPHTNKASIYLERKQFDKALFETKMAIKKKPDLAESWLLAGMLHERLGDQSLAKEYYQKNIEIIEKRIQNSSKDQIALHRFDKAVALILLEEEAEGKKEMVQIRQEYPGHPINELINIYINFDREDYLQGALDGQSIEIN